MIKFPDEEKYRKIRTENQKFHSQVWSLPEAQQFMFGWGWTEVRQGWVVQVSACTTPLDSCYSSLQVEDYLVLLSDEDCQLVKQVLMKILR